MHLCFLLVPPLNTIQDPCLGNLAIHDGLSLPASISDQDIPP